ncbi:acetyl-coenzyme A synthetase, partial [Salipiger pacificus]|nr:acetyl-coenzyme A synthetase [Alloyangia pacifica]
MKDDAQTATAGTYAPSEDFVAKAHVDVARYDEMYARSISDPDGFWGEQAQRLDWMARPTKIKDTNFDFGNVSIKWFEDGVLNVAYNCIDRHLPARAEQTAIIFEPDNPEDP